MGAVYQVPIGLVGFSFSSLVVLWQEFGFDKSVEFAEQDVGKYRTQDGALGDAAERFVERMVGGEIALSTANPELCMTLSRHTAPQSMVV